MLRVAVPNKGSLAEEASRMLRDAGYRQRADTRDLSLTDEPNDVTFFYLRPKDIATYVGEGQLHLGISGHDLTEESSSSVTEVLPLGFGESRFCYAAPTTGNIQSVADLSGARIATSYPRLVRADLSHQRIAAQNVIRLDGAVEISIELGVADAIADVVGSGRTLAQHGLTTIGSPIMTSQAVIIERGAGFTRASDPTEVTDAKKRFLGRVDGVVYARRYLMLDYDCPSEVREKAAGITPGVQAPTVASLMNADGSPSDWVAVRSMVRKTRINDVMDDLAALGCKGIVTSELRSCRGVPLSSGNGS